MSEPTRLSASRIACAEKCSWVYWCKYLNKIPDSSNTGASRGSVCHNIFEYLGKERHRKHYNSILNANSIEGSKAVKKLVNIQSAQQDPPVDSLEELDLIDQFIVNGLSFDFYGDAEEKPFDAISEKVFELEINENDKKYYIYGFIDKLFLYDKGKKAVIRDFKTSKKIYVGSEVTDNLQNLIYCLAVSKLYPKYKKLAFAGGLFANVKLNQKINQLDWVDELFVFPAMGDSGLCAGAAILRRMKLLSITISMKGFKWACLTAST
jgi:hypothetical protein